MILLCHSLILNSFIFLPDSLSFPPYSPPTLVCALQNGNIFAQFLRTLICPENSKMTTIHTLPHFHFSSSSSIPRFAAYCSWLLDSLWQTVVHPPTPLSPFTHVLFRPLYPTFFHFASALLLFPLPFTLFFCVTKFRKIALSAVSACLSSRSLLTQIASKNASKILSFPTKPKIFAAVNF